MNVIIPQEDFEGFKIGLRLAGFIPNKKLNQEMWPKINNELDSLSFGRVDEHCFQEKLEIEDERKHEHANTRRRMARMMGLLAGMNNDPFNRYMR